MDDITLLLVLEARDQATRVLDQITGRVKGYEEATKAAAAQASRSAADIEAANAKVAVASDAYDKALKNQAAAQQAANDAARVAATVTTETEAVQAKAAATAASYQRALESQGNAQILLREKMLASKAAQEELATAQGEEFVAAAAKAKATIEEEEAALVRLQQAEKLVATRAKEMAAAQDAAAAPIRAEEAAFLRLEEAEQAVAARARDVAAAQDAAATAQAAATTEATKGSGALRGVGIAAGATAIAVGYIGVKAVEAAGNYQSSTNRLVTSAGEQQSSLDLVRQGMLNLEGQVGDTADQLSAAMYKVESGGQHGAAGLKVLQAAAEGAKTENADLTTVADALTSVMVDYKIPAEQAAAVTSKLVAATASGKMTFQEMAGSLAAIMPVASAAQIPLNDILGDLASMTVHGMSAQQATQNMADAIRHLQTAAQNGTMAKEFALLGLNARQLSTDLGSKGLSGTINEITDAIKSHMGAGATTVILQLQTALKGLPPAVRELGAKVIDGSMTLKQFGAAVKELDPISAKQAQQFLTLAGATHQIGSAQLSGAQVMQSYAGALRQAMGDATGMNVALMIGGDNAGVTAGAIRSVSGATTEAGNHVKGWSDIQGTFNQKMSQLKGSLDAAKISIGTGLLPAITAIASAVVKVVTPIATWMAKHSTLSAIILASIGVLSALVVVIWAINTALTAMTAIPVVAIIVGIVAAVAALVAGVIYAYNHWGWFKTAVLDTWNAIKVAALFVWHDVLEPAFKGIAAAATWLWGHVLKPYFEAWSALFRDVIGPVVMWLWRNVVEPAFKGIQIEISVAWTILKPVFALIGAALSVLGDIFSWLYREIVVPIWQGIQIAISIAWAIIQVIWGVMQIEIKILAAIFGWLWDQVKATWEGIKLAIELAWQLIKPYWDEMVAFIEVFIVPKFQWLHDKISTAWNNIKDTISSVWNQHIKPVFDAFAHFITDTVEPAFRSGVDAVGRAWDAIQDKAKAPVRFVVNTVLNDGLLAAYNWIASRFGVKPDDVHVKLPAGFAAGGRIPGADSHADNMLAMVATGEHIMPTSRTRRWLPVLESIRLHDRLPMFPGDLSGWGIKGYASGGVVGALEGLGSNLWDLFTNPGKLIRNVVGGVVDSVPGAGIIRDMVVGGGHRLLDGLISWVKGSAGSGSVGSAMAFLKSAVGHGYGLGDAGPDLWDCSGIVSSVWNVLHGRSPYSHTFSTSNEAGFFPIPGLGGLLTAGWTNPGESGPGGNGIGHTAGVLAGVPFESTGSGGVHMGVGVTPVTSFANVGHFDSGGPLYPGWTAAYNGTGHTEWVHPHGPSGTVVFDFRGSHLMSDSDVDKLIDRIDKRLVRTMLPAAGVQVRR